MQFPTSGLYIFILVSSLSVAFGSREHQVREALLKRKLYLSAREACGYKDGNLLNGVKEILKHLPSSEEEENQPQSQYLDALTKAYCSSRDFQKAIEITPLVGFSDGGLVDSTGTESLEAASSSVQDSDNYLNYSKNQVETKSYSTGIVFIFGAVIGFIVCHYTFLLKTSPSNGTIPTKVLRRPEL